MPPPPPLPGQPGARPTGTAAVRIETSDTHGVTILVGGGNSISGRIRFENEPEANVTTRILLTSTLGGGSPLVTSNPDGTFTFADLPTGEYRLRLISLGLRRYVKSARHGEVDALTQPITVGNGNRPLEIVVSSSGAQVGGRVTDAQGRPFANATVVFVPDAFRGNPDFYRSLQSDPAGRVPAVSIAPGNYKVFAWAEIEPYSWFDPDVIEKYSDKGIAVQLKESENAMPEIRVIPAGGAQ